MNQQSEQAKVNKTGNTAKISVPATEPSPAAAQENAKVASKNVAPVQEQKKAASTPAQSVQPVLTPEQVAQLQEKAAKADENWNRLLRVTADFDNFKKRAAREKQDAIKYANEALLTKLIPVLDTFEMALNAANASTGTVQSLHAGITMISSQLKNVLKEAGLEEVDARNKAFDPNFHEAVAQKETHEIPEGHVVQQMRKGYKFRDRLVRAATVVVAKKPVK